MKRVLDILAAVGVLLSSVQIARSCTNNNCESKCAHFNEVLLLDGNCQKYVPYKVGKDRCWTVCKEGQIMSNQLTWERWDCDYCCYNCAAAAVSAMREAKDCMDCEGPFGPFNDRGYCWTSGE